MRQLNSYIDSTFHTQDDLLESVLISIEKNGMHSISVSPSSGKLLTFLVSLSRSKKILEIGALGGYSGICLARGFGKDGQLTSLELEESYTHLAHKNLIAAGFDGQVSYMPGPALESLEQLLSENKRFDFFFIDADKENYENYLEACIRLADNGALIVADNVLANGSVADENVKPVPFTKTMKKFNKTVANHPQLESLLIPIGDGMTVAKVRMEE